MNYFEPHRNNFRRSPRGGVRSIHSPGHTQTQLFHAAIARISPRIDQHTRTMAVELDVQNARLTPGTLATVQWPVERDYATLLVPAAVITTNLQRTLVTRIRDGKAEWVDVQTGGCRRRENRVLGDVRDGDQVVLPAGKRRTRSRHRGRDSLHPEQVLKWLMCECGEKPVAFRFV